MQLDAPFRHGCAEKNGIQTTTGMGMENKMELQKILEDFAREVLMTTCMTDETGADPECCFDRYPLCAAIRKNRTATTFVCSQTNTAMLAVVRKTRKPEIDLCEAGMIRIVVPVLQDGKLKGQVFACGLAAEDEELDSFLLAKQLDLPEQEVLELAKSTPFSSIEKLKEPVDRLFRILNP
jgi:ligand-binding sensor protein